MIKTPFGEFSRKTARKNIDVINAAYESYCKKNEARILNLRADIGMDIVKVVRKANEIDKLVDEGEKASKQHDKLLGRI